MECWVRYIPFGIFYYSHFFKTVLFKVKCDYYNYVRHILWLQLDKIKVESIKKILLFLGNGLTNKDLDPHSPY